MSVYDMLKSPAEWEKYKEYKTVSGSLSKSEAADLIAFIDGREYIAAADRVAAQGFAPPVKKQVGKSGSSKKRTVYLFARDENYLLKLLTFYLTRKYDGIFSECLYSFRAGSGVGRAVSKILHSGTAAQCYTYKADISNYFNSVDVSKLIPMLREVFSGEEDVCALFEKLLTDTRVYEKGGIINESKGVMAGAPFSVFLANIYLSDMDRLLEEKARIYARYSDDIIVFDESRERIEELSSLIKGILEEKGLSINESKEFFTSPGEKWSFLGFEFENGTVDVSAVAAAKIKAKIRRRARSIKRWQVKKGASPGQGVRAFLRAVNKKFFYSSDKNDLTWARWYFPVINTDKTLKEIDACVQQWARYVYTGRHSKSNYSLRYETLRELGYVSLVNEWYSRKSG